MWETWVQSLGWEDPMEGKGYPLQYSGLENFMDCTGRETEVRERKSREEVSWGVG